MAWRVKVIEEDPVSGLEGYSFYDFPEDMQAWRFREFVIKAYNVKSVFCPYMVEY